MLKRKNTKDVSKSEKLHIILEMHHLILVFHCNLCRILVWIWTAELSTLIWRHRYLSHPTQMALAFLSDSSSKLDPWIKNVHSKSPVPRRSNTKVFDASWSALKCSITKDFISYRYEDRPRIKSFDPACPVLNCLNTKNFSRYGQLRIILEMYHLRWMLLVFHCNLCRILVWIQITELSTLIRHHR